MSIMEKAIRGANIPLDHVYVIYGKPGSGKTTLASTFPKSKEKPALYIDVLEGGAGSIEKKDLEDMLYLPIETYEEFDEAMTALEAGFFIDSTGKRVDVLNLSSVIIDSLTQLEYMLKVYLMIKKKKTEMNQNLWGDVNNNEEFLFNLLRRIHVKTGAHVVGICHERELKDDENAEFNRRIPKLTPTASISLCAKATYVWYCAIEKEERIDKATSKVTTEHVFATYIAAHPYLESKIQKPRSFTVPSRVTDLTYPIFKEKVLDKIKGVV